MISYAMDKTDESKRNVFNFRENSAFFYSPGTFELTNRRYLDGPNSLPNFSWHYYCYYH